MAGLSSPHRVPHRPVPGQHAGGPSKVSPANRLHSHVHGRAQPSCGRTPDAPACMVVHLAAARGNDRRPRRRRVCHGQSAPCSSFRALGSGSPTTLRGGHRGGKSDSAQHCDCGAMASRWPLGSNMTFFVDKFFFPFFSPLPIASPPGVLRHLVILLHHDAAYARSTMRQHGHAHVPHVGRLLLPRT